MLRLLLAIVGGVFLSMPAAAYDEALARTYEQFFSSFEEQQLPKALQMMPAEKVVEAIKKGENIVLMDVRTEQEQSIIGLTYENTLHLPMNEVFKPENLAKLPADRKIVVTCKSGVRCTVIAIGLRNIGFSNVFEMKGGLMALMKYLDPKTAF